jgi:hypothetical protein
MVLTAHAAEKKSTNLNCPTGSGSKAGDTSTFEEGTAREIENV